MFGKNAFKQRLRGWLGFCRMGKTVRRNGSKQALKTPLLFSEIGWDCTLSGSAFININRCCDSARLFDGLKQWIIYFEKLFHWLSNAWKIFEKKVKKILAHIVFCCIFAVPNKKSGSEVGFGCSLKTWGQHKSETVAERLDRFESKVKS